MFRFFGVLLGIAICSGAPINLLLAPPAWKQISGQSLTPEDLSEIDTDYVQGLMFVRENPEAFIGIDFSTRKCQWKRYSTSLIQSTRNNEQLSGIFPSSHALSFE